MLAAQLLAYFFSVLLLLSMLKGNSPPSPSLLDPLDNHGFSYDKTQHPPNLLPKHRNSTLSFGIVNTVATVVTILLALLNILVYKLRQLHELNFTKNVEVSTSSPLECRRFSLAEIYLATNNFDDSLIIGQGGFGKVYKGSIDNWANTLAIKRLNPLSKQGAPEFWTEIRMLSKFRHAHLVSLIGYCDSYNEMVMVYEYMALGTIADHLYKIGKNGNKNVPLSWVQRLNIGIGAARGLEYLHTGTGAQHRVIHRDVKSSNILLDNNLTAKISDFGLSIIGPANQSCTYVSTDVKGTKGYLDPEYFYTRKLTRKSDVYSFGVVLFELLSGRPAVGLRPDQDKHSLAKWAKYCVKEGTIEKLVDPKLNGEIKPDSLTAFVKIADQSLDEHPKKRPTMSEVVSALDLVLKLQQRRDYSKADDFSSSDVTEASSSQNIVEVSKVKDNDHDDNKDIQSFRSRLMKWRRKTRPPFSVKPWRRSREKRTYEHRFTIHEIMDMTKNFSEKMYLGSGAFGQVYKGTLRNGTHVAVKRHQKGVLTISRAQVKYETEIKIMSGLAISPHQNLISLISYCYEQSEMILVYEYASNGRLTSHFYNNTDIPPLSWKQRLKICIGVAQGLKYLHGNGIIHRDLQTKNILLDENFVPKIAGFGVSMIAPDRLHSSLSLQSAFQYGIVGSFGYIDPENMTGILPTDKCDVYSFGVVLIELLCARPVIDLSLPNEQLDLAKWAITCHDRGILDQIIDPNLVRKVNPSSLKKFGGHTRG